MRYVFGDYELDTQRYELRHAGTPCALEPQAFNVLLYLVQHRDRVVPKDELLEHIWPQQYISEAVLSQRLMFVRRAVGDSGSQQRLIKTMHRRGYRFVAPVEERPEGGSGQNTPPAPLSPALSPPPQERSAPGELGHGGPPLQCPQCQHANPAGAKFCNACATPLQGGAPRVARRPPPGHASVTSAPRPLRARHPGPPGRLSRAPIPPPT